METNDTTRFNSPTAIHTRQQIEDFNSFERNIIATTPQMTEAKNSLQQKLQDGKLGKRDAALIDKLLKNEESSEEDFIKLCKSVAKKISPTGTSPKYNVRGLRSRSAKIKLDDNDRTYLSYVLKANILDRLEQAQSIGADTAKLEKAISKLPGLESDQEFLNSISKAKKIRNIRLELERYESNKDRTITDDLTYTALSNELEKLLHEGNVDEISFNALHEIDSQISKWKNIINEINKYNTYEYVLGIKERTITEDTTCSALLSELENSIIDNMGHILASNKTDDVLKILSNLNSTEMVIPIKVAIDMVKTVHDSENKIKYAYDCLSYQNSEGALKPKEVQLPKKALKNYILTHSNQFPVLFIQDVMNDPDLTRVNEYISQFPQGKQPSVEEALNALYLK